MRFAARLFSEHRARADGTERSLSSVGKDPLVMNVRTIIVASAFALPAPILGSAGLGCCPPPRTAPCPATVKAPVDKTPESLPHVYKLEFSVASGEAGAPPLKQQFVLNLVDRQHGDVTVGRNVPLQTTAANGAVSPRADVGLRLSADCMSSGDDVMVEVRLEVSDTEASTAGGAVPIHKASAQGAVLLKVGQPAVALKMDDAHKQYEVDVIATRLR